MSSDSAMENSDPSARELAVAAGECPALVPARTLAEWVGTGKPLTKKGVLKPAAAVEACNLLGIELPMRNPRSASDIDQLMLVWMTALAAGFIEIDQDWVAAGQPLSSWVDGDPETVLGIWAQCAFECLGLTSNADEMDLEHLAVLAGLYERDGSASPSDLRDDIAELNGSPSVCLCLDCVSGETEDELDDPLLEERYVEHVVKTLGEFGIAVIRDGSVESTPLGRWLTDFMFRKSAPAVDLDAARLLYELELLPPKVTGLMSRPWRSARTPAEAVRELLAAGESTSGHQRLLAVTLARECGPEAMPAWREWAVKDGFGAYARTVLAEEDGTAPSDADTAWITVDTLTIMVDSLPPDVPAGLAPGLLQGEFGGNLAGALPLIENSGHPDASRLVSLLTPTHPVIGILSPGERPIPETRLEAAAAGPRYRIKVQLRGVAKPPVWRRLEVPAELRLSELHLVIQAAMGWENCHMHVFDDGKYQYGLPDPELGHRDESAVRLSQVLTGVGAKLSYTYDFGDDWEHTVTLEKILPADPGMTGVVCTAGKGACPPEDCGGVWGYMQLRETLADPDSDEHDEMLEWLGLGTGDDFDPHEFSVEEVNRIFND